MNTKITIYASFGVLAHEKHPFFTLDAPVTNVYDIYEAVLPDGWTTTKNDTDATLITSPHGTVYLGKEILTNHGDDAVFEWYDGGTHRIVLELEKKN